MPSIYDTILREDPLAAARQEATARLEAERTKQQSQFLQTLQGLSPEVRQGAITGQAAAQLFGAIRDKRSGAPDPVDTSPEVVRARQNADLSKSLQGIEADPASAEWATQAAAQAKANGREDLAFQLLGEAAQRRQAEAKLAREQDAQVLKDRRATINTLPNAQKFSLIVNDKDAAGKLFNLKGKALDAFVKDADDSLATIRDKNRAELNKIKPVNPANITKGDIVAVDSTLTSLGYDADAFNPGFGKDEDARNQFMNILADQARTEQELRAKRGETLPLDQITTELMTELETTGIFTKSPDTFGGGFTMTDDFNAGAVRNAFKSRIDTLQPTGGTQAPPTVQPEAAPAAPAVNVDFDFTSN